MGSDYLFPGSVAVLKLMLKLFIEQEVRVPDWLKAMMAFPIDIAFLAFSFAAAILYTNPAEKLQGSNAKTALAFLLACLAMSVLITWLSKKAERYYTNNKYWLSFLAAACSYVFALVAVYISFVPKVWL